LVAAQIGYQQSISFVLLCFSAGRMMRCGNIESQHNTNDHQELTK